MHFNIDFQQYLSFKLFIACHIHFLVSSRASTRHRKKYIHRRVYHAKPPSRRLIRIRRLQVHTQEIFPRIQGANRDVYIIQRYISLVYFFSSRIYSKRRERSPNSNISQQQPRAIITPLIFLIRSRQRLKRSRKQQLQTFPKILPIVVLILIYFIVSRRCKEIFSDFIIL